MIQEEDLYVKYTHIIVKKIREFLAEPSREACYNIKINLSIAKHDNLIVLIPKYLCLIYQTIFPSSQDF